MHPRAPSYVNKSNDKQRPHKCSDGERIGNANTVIRNEWKRTLTGNRRCIQERLHKAVIFLVYSARCVKSGPVSDVKNVPRPFSSVEGWRSNPISLQPIWPC